MAEFVASFTTGFQSVVEQDLPKRLNGVKIINLFDGLIHFSYSGNSRDLDKIIYFNNTFFVLKTMKGKGLNFPSMVGAVASERKYYLINKGTFRVRFVQENQFTKVDKNISRRAEEIVLSNSKLQIDRLNPTTEIWYSIRREGFAFCGQLISKREFTEKNLNKGELRPEIAYFISSFADINVKVENPVIAEPFCGYGAIPIQIAKKFRFSKFYVSDIDDEKIKMVSAKKQLQNENIDVRTADAMELSHIEDKSVDRVISDPPWGFYEDIGDIADFYRRMFKSLLRILKDDGKMIILTARKEELETVAKEFNLEIEAAVHTLVNGKKAGVYKLITSC